MEVRQFSKNEKEKGNSLGRKIEILALDMKIGDSSDLTK